MVRKFRKKKGALADLGGPDPAKPGKRYMTVWLPEKAYLQIIEGCKALSFTRIVSKSEFVRNAIDHYLKALKEMK